MYYTLEVMEVLQYVTPKTVDKFVGNKSQIKMLAEFLSSNGKQDTTNILCVLGPTGCGKTTLCNLMFHKYNKQVLEIGKDNLVGSDIKTVLHNFAVNMTIESLMLKRDKVVFVDDIDILMNIDKLLFSKVLSVNKLLRQKNITIVLTCNMSEERKINEHSKDVRSIKLSHPFYNDSYAYIMNCFDVYDVPHDAQSLLKVCQRCKGSIRETILNLGSSHDSLNDKFTEAAFKDLNNFEISKKILMKNYNHNELVFYQRTDLGLVPYILYENIPDELNTNYKFKRSKSAPTLLDHYININNAFIHASRFEEQAYTSLDWQFLTYANILKMNVIHNVIQETEKKANVKEVKYRFSQMLSKGSHKNIMGKKIKGISNNANVSKMVIVNAVDVQTQSESKEPVKSRKNKTKKIEEGGSTMKDMFGDGANIANTYEKYFA